jgi:hypothetical protein
MKRIISVEAVRGIPNIKIDEGRVCGVRLENRQRCHIRSSDMTPLPECWNFSTWT